ncbi:MAG: hypothetical protein AAGA75_01430 [Cyanobacteria bacterium P01_E01_bin.6]
MVELLRQEWLVLALNGESEALAKPLFWKITRFLNQDDEDLTRFDTRVEPFEEW